MAFNGIAHNHHASYNGLALMESRCGCATVSPSFKLGCGCATVSRFEELCCGCATVTRSWEISLWLCHRVSLWGILLWLHHRDAVLRNESVVVPLCLALGNSAVVVPPWLGLEKLGSGSDTVSRFCGIRLWYLFCTTCNCHTAILSVLINRTLSLPSHGYNGCIVSHNSSGIR
jgi:hypothetical protein